MALLNFMTRFVPKILAGEKTHTIRAMRIYPIKEGETLHLYTGLRTKKAKLLMRAPCVRVESIRIKDGAFGDENHAAIYIDGLELNRDEREMFARRDGFKDMEEMIGFWRGRLPFEGNVIHWRKR
jgi:hypothetical protein